MNKKEPVKDHMIRTHSLCSWNLHFRRSINDWVMDEASCLLQRLEKGDRNYEDKAVERGSEEGILSEILLYLSI